MMLRTSPVTDASAWSAEELGQDGSWIYRLDDEQITELERALAPLDRVPVLEIRKQDFALPRLGAMLQAVKLQIEEGRGIALLRGLPVARHSKEDAARLFWMIGLQLGIPVTQNARAHLLGHVQDEGVKYGHKTRGYNTSAKLNFHCDNADVVGLACLRVAKSGGLSRVSSATALFNTILNRDPALLAPLFEGFFYDLKGEHLPGRTELSDHRIPVFSEFEGKLSCRYLRNAITPAFAKAGLEPTALELRALDLFDELAGSAMHSHDMKLEQGDIQLLNNHVTVHSRTAFEDYEEEDRKRHLLRLWLRTDHRPLAPEFAERFGPGTARMGVPTPQSLGIMAERDPAELAKTALSH